MQDVQHSDDSDSDAQPNKTRRRVLRADSDSDSDVPSQLSSLPSRPGRSFPAPRAAGGIPPGGGDGPRRDTRAEDDRLPADRAVPVDTGNSKFRHWVFTWNNYPEDWQEILRRGNVTYICAQGEIGASGTRHLQGVISFPSPRTASGVRRLAPGWHVENMRGTIEQAVAYCSKEETRDPDFGEPFEFGVRPLSAGTAGGRSDLKAIAAVVQSGGTITDVAAAYPVGVILFSRGIERLIGLQQRPRDFSTEVFWFYGPTGTGKTRAACAADPAAYWKSPTSQWWCGYEGHEAVIIDDYRTDFCKFNVLLRLFDRYPMQVEVKGGAREFRAKRIYITTPKSPTETWNLRSDEDLGQLTRRIKEVRHFPAIFAAAVALIA